MAVGVARSTLTWTDAAALPRAATVAGSTRSVAMLPGDKGCKVDKVGGHMKGGAGGKVGKVRKSGDTNGGTGGKVSKGGHSKGGTGGTGGTGCKVGKPRGCQARGRAAGTRSGRRAKDAGSSSVSHGTGGPQWRFHDNARS